MRKQFGFGQSVSISFYSTGSNSDDIYTFEARNGGKLEMIKVATKSFVSRLLNNGYRGSKLHFEGVDTETRKFFMQCAGMR
ncbi:MAG: hypothetical protein HYT72_00205 [Candidatus Aenigmarchaeota archaeon]|nr:hypothetical protein [Candidatus Aenigmarchaeota archaeon]